SLLFPRCFQWLFLRVRDGGSPPVGAQVLSTLDRQAVDVRTPEQTAPAHRPHGRKAAVVREHADGVRRKPENPGGVAGGEQVIWMLVHGVWSSFEEAVWEQQPRL